MVVYVVGANPLSMEYGYLIILAVIPIQKGLGTGRSDLLAVGWQSLALNGQFSRGEKNTTFKICTLYLVLGVQFSEGGNSFLACRGHERNKKKNSYMDEEFNPSLDIGADNNCSL